MFRHLTNFNRHLDTCFSFLDFKKSVLGRIDTDLCDKIPVGNLLTNCTNYIKLHILFVTQVFNLLQVSQHVFWQNSSKIDVSIRQFIIIGDELLFMNIS